MKRIILNIITLINATSFVGLVASTIWWIWASDKGAPINAATTAFSLLIFALFAKEAINQDGL